MGIRKRPTTTAAFRIAIGCVVLRACLLALPLPPDPRPHVPHPTPHPRAPPPPPRVFRDVLAKSGKPEEKTALARRLIGLAEEDKALTNHFGLLAVAKEIAVEAGNVEVAARAIDETARAFQVDALELKAETIKLIHK